MQRFRFLSQRLGALSGARLILLTGAHQTGKTSLARKAFPHLRLLDLEDAGDREELRKVRAEDWAAAVGPAVLDEIQHEPRLVDMVRSAFDAGQVERTVLVPSPRALGLYPVDETLDSRAFVCELWPLMASELAHPGSGDPPRPLLDRLLREAGRADEVFASLPAERHGKEARSASAALEQLSCWGGMPALLRLPPGGRRTWLRAYDATSLKRDPEDLTRRELVPFRRFQRLCAALTGRHLSVSELAQQSGVNTATARRYLQALCTSYQALLLPPYPDHLTGPVVKAPKVHWIDLGLWRHLAGTQGEVTGPMFETLVVTEIHKWIRTAGLPVDLASYRTRTGLEVDLLLSTSQGVWGLVAKSGAEIQAADWRPLRRVAEALGDRWRGGLVVSSGTRLERLDTGVWAVPAERLLV
jgi:predicted AAA+ superfamily ATPase